MKNPPKTTLHSAPAAHRLQVFGGVWILLAAIALSVGLGGCRAPVEPVPVTSTAPSLTDGQSTASPPVTREAETPSSTPTSTPIPLAAVVNGTPIALATYDAHLQRLLDAISADGTVLAPEEASALVINDLIDQALLSQAAAAAGFEMDDAQLDEKMLGLAVDVGGADNLALWMERNHYSEASFRLELAESSAAAWMRDRIVAEVPPRAEQIHARQIFLLNASEAQTVLERLQAGVDFDALAQTYDPLGFGELGWFPEDYLTEKAVETAAFGLEVNEISGIIETDLGYHIVKVIERLPDRPLDPDALLDLQIHELEAWLANARAQGQIQILLPDLGA